MSAAVEGSYLDVIGGTAIRAFRLMMGSASHVLKIPGGGLAAHEGVKGGHTIRDHVGKTAEELAARLERDSARSQVSTFFDEAIANKTLSDAIQANQGGLSAWLTSNTAGRFVLTGQAQEAIGMVMSRTEVVISDHYRFILEKSNRFAEGFRVVTGYVE
jgi:filamentous hemagglutinin